jgi:antitoxin component of RelBE/YafQ-DinJ toxin-antitoxin module
MATQTKHIDSRISESTHAEIKQVCEASNISISKTIKTLIELFLHDADLQQRIFKEAKIK